MSEHTPYWLAVISLAALIGLAGCTEGLTELDADPSVLDRDAPADDESEEAPADLATIVIGLSTTDLEVSQTVAVDMSARADDGTTIEDVDATWHTGDETVVEVNADGHVTALQDGSTDIWASVGDIESNRLTLTVSPVDPTESRYVVVRPSQYALAPGESVQMSAEARRSDGRPLVGLAVEWRTSDESVLTVDEEGLATAQGEGSARVEAHLEGGTSLSSTIHVSSDSTWRRARLLRPSGAIALRGEPIEIEVDLRDVAVDAPESAGTPIQPESVAIMIDGEDVAQATPEWEKTSYLLDVSGLDEGVHELTARVAADGDVYTTPPRVLDVRAGAQNFAESWENLGGAPDDRWAQDGELGPNNGNAPALAVDSENNVFVALEEPNRGNQAKIYVRRWNQDDARWESVRTHEDGHDHGLQLRHWNSQHEWWPSNTAQYVDLAVDDRDRVLLTYTQEAVDYGGNGDEREKRWFDVFVFRYEQGFGPDGGAGWRLLTSGQQDYLFNAPKPDKAQHPPPADVDENDDVFTPKVMWDGSRGRVTAAWVSSPFPRDSTFLDVRYWDDSANEWTTTGERLELSGAIPELREALVDAEGGILAVIENIGADGQDQFEVWRLDVDESEWTRLDATGRLASVTTAENGELLGTNITHGILRGATVRDGVESSGGAILNRSAWTDANAPTFVHITGEGRAPYALWTEGPIGSQQWIFGAHYSQSGWTPMDMALFTRSTGDTRLSAASGPDGRLVIARQSPRTDRDEQYSLLVVRSREPLVE